MDARLIRSHQIIRGTNGVPSTLSKPTYTREYRASDQAEADLEKKGLLSIAIVSNLDEDIE